MNLKSWQYFFIGKYKGKILYRVMLTIDNFISADGEQPYEIHFISFDSENDLSVFMKDDSRLKVYAFKR